MLLPRACVVLCLTAAAPAFADTLRLSDGTELDGRIERSGSQVILHIDGGSIGFDESEVASTDKAATPLDEFFQRRTAVAPTDINGRLTLARWATQQGLRSGAIQLYKEVLRLAPDNQAAHTALGHTRVQGRWLTEAQFKRSSGLEQYLGVWMSREEAQAKRTELLSWRDRKAQPASPSQASASEAQVVPPEFSPDSTTYDEGFTAGWMANQSAALWGSGVNPPDSRPPSAAWPCYGSAAFSPTWANLCAGRFSGYRRAGLFGVGTAAIPAQPAPRARALPGRSARRARASRSAPAPRARGRAASRPNRAGPGTPARSLSVQPGL